ncbi:hypothetical protein D3C87_1701520 [compost metagenome]
MRHRASQQIPLEVRAALRGQAFQLLGGFHAFRRRRDIQAAADAVNGADDGQRLLAGFDVLRERHVDLDLVELERAQIAQRRVARPEIVQRHFDAQVLQAAQRHEIAG